MSEKRRRSSLLQDLVNKRASEGEDQAANIDSDPWRLASFGVIDLLKKLVEEGGIDVNAKDDRGMPPIIWAIRSGHEEVATYLLDKGADMESFGYAGMRALHHACSCSHEGCIALLLDRGADANGADEYGNTGLHYAAARGVLNIIIRLISSGAEPDVANVQGSTPLQKACAFGQNAVVKKLIIEKGSEVGRSDKDNNTPLHIAARSGFGSLVSLLLDLGAPMQVANKAGKSPKDVALNASIAALLTEPS
ncbi:unnamed protein product [Ectocarpus sp. 6 AP-2014]